MTFFGAFFFHSMFFFVEIVYAETIRGKRESERQEHITSVRSPTERMARIRRAFNASQPSLLIFCDAHRARNTGRCNMHATWTVSDSVARIRRTSGESCGTRGAHQARFRCLPTFPLNLQ
jgi:hypothetical protein